MASYNVDFKPSVHEDFRRLPKSVVQRVMKRIEKLNDEAFPHGVVKLEGVERLYRIVVGDYRGVIYEVDTQAKQIMILYVPHRREVYRAL